MKILRIRLTLPVNLLRQGYSKDKESLSNQMRHRIGTGVRKHLKITPAVTVAAPTAPSYIAREGGAVARHHHIMRAGAVADLPACHIA